MSIQVASNGTIRLHGRVLPLYVSRSEIRYVTVRGKRCTAAHIILTAMGSPRERGMVAAYADDDRGNLHPSNLYWTPKSNTLVINAVSEDTRKVCVQLDREGYTMKAIARSVGIHPTTVSRILGG